MAWKELDQSYEFIDRPLRWHNKGLSQTRSGYGRKLTSAQCVRLADGRIRRVYINLLQQFGNRLDYTE